MALDTHLLSILMVSLALGSFRLSAFPVRVSIREYLVELSSFKLVCDTAGNADPFLGDKHGSKKAK